MSTPAVRNLLPVLCLLAGSLCQWVSWTLTSEPARLGMGAPVPLSWEAGQSGGIAGLSGYGGIDTERPRLWQKAPRPVSWVLRATRWVVPVGGQERLLMWGRLLLEGG
ncbi:MAG TPA: hypothetical protein VF168_03120 [Trueperaceae bacterium]